MKLVTKVTNVKINLFLIFVIIIKYIPLQTNIQYQNTPEIFSSLIYIIYLLKKNALNYTNIFFLSFVDDVLKSSYLGITILQHFVYVFYIDFIKRKYSNNILFDWLCFSILNILLLSSKYIVINFLKNYDILTFAIIFKKVFVTIAFFPLTYYLINKFIYNKKINA